MKNFKLPPRMVVRLVVALIAALAAWFGKNTTEKGSQKTTHQEGEFQVFLNCTLSKSKYNDGDSFTVSHNGKKQEYRLYFTDTPESKDKPYADHQKRVKEQGRALGGLNYNETIHLGQEAKEFTQKILQAPFKVFTTGELVYEGPRQHAFIQVNHKGEPRWLHELIVENGLGRIHTRGAQTPEGMSYHQQKERLKKLEAEARKQKRGAWKN